jgi:hypothetical protein
MQTFLPYASFERSALVLDNRRLGKQRVEAKQILDALENPTNGWRHHPAVRMWAGHELGLAAYQRAVMLEWERRGFRNDRLVLPTVYCALDRPLWLGRADFHASHRSNLLRKDPTWYGQFGWDVPDDLPYVWPT